MEPRIIKGHKFLCKKTVVMKDSNRTREEAYTKGKIYMCEISSYYPGDRHSCGHITNNNGNKAHAWPYDPENHLWCHDSWTDFFEDLGE